MVFHPDHTPTPPRPQLPLINAQISHLYYFLSCQMTQVEVDLGLPLLSSSLLQAWRQWSGAAGSRHLPLMKHTADRSKIRERCELFSSCHTFLSKCTVATSFIRNCISLCVCMCVCVCVCVCVCMYVLMLVCVCVYINVSICALVCAIHLLIR